MRSKLAVGSSQWSEVGSQGTGDSGQESVDSWQRGFCLQHFCILRSAFIISAEGRRPVVNPQRRNLPPANRRTELC
jgi:hypothetical protein